MYTHIYICIYINYVIKSARARTHTNRASGSRRFNIRVDFFLAALAKKVFGDRRIARFSRHFLTRKKKGKRMDKAARVFGHRRGANAAVREVDVREHRDERVAIGPARHTIIDR